MRGWCWKPSIHRAIAWDLPAGREMNPGHAIETAWFIMEIAQRRGDADLLRKAAGHYRLVIRAWFGMPNTAVCSTS